MIDKSDIIAAPVPVLNPATIEQYVKRRTSLLERLAVAYFEEAPLFHSRMRSAKQQGDLEALRLNAHALKACSHNLGAQRLGTLCQSIESAAVGGDHKQLETLFADLGPYCFDVEQELREAVLRHTGKSISVPEAQKASEPEMVD